jgi:hypothetical protein
MRSELADLKKFANALLDACLISKILYLQIGAAIVN